MYRVGGHFISSTRRRGNHTNSIHSLNIFFQQRFNLDFIKNIIDFTRRFLACMIIADKISRLFPSSLDSRTTKHLEDMEEIGEPSLDKIPRPTGLLRHGNNIDDFTCWRIRGAKSDHRQPG